MPSFFHQAQEELPFLVQVMERFHRLPELSFQEYGTTRCLKDLIRDMGLELIDLGMDTGAVALLRGSRQGRLAAIRADIDAVPVQEPADHAVRSTREGVMHACGHDFHMTCALGAAMLLQRAKELVEGDLVFIFQPAEEITRGAAKMLEEGLLEKLPAKADAIFALHSEPRLPTGQVISSPDYASASKINFRIRLRGTVGHSGAPHSYIDVIPAGTAIVDAIQTMVSRASDPQQELVCAVHTIKAGEVDFFVTDVMEMTGTIRAFDEALSNKTLEGLAAMVSKMAEAYSCDSHMEIIPEVPPQVNHPHLQSVARHACHKVFGEQNTLARGPLFMGAEDFSLFGQVIPSHFYWIGTGFPGKENPLQHEPDFRIDYRAIPYGVALLVESVLGVIKS